MIVRDVELRTGRTLYERFGDLPVLVLSGLLIVVGWLVALTSDTDPKRTARARRERQALHRTKGACVNGEP